MQKEVVKEAKREENKDGKYNKILKPEFIQLPQKKKTEFKVSFIHSRFYIGLMRLRPDIAGYKCSRTSGFVPDYNREKCKNIALFFDSVQ